MAISLIAALDQNHVIGYKNRIPWHIPGELVHFKNTTMGKPIVMGRRTFTSIGKALPGRENWILSSQKDLSAPGCTVFHQLEDLQQAITDHPHVMIIGGASLYAHFLPLAQQMILTHIEHSYTGDTYFPSFSKQDWQPTLLKESQAKANIPAYQIIQWERK